MEQLNLFATPGPPEGKFSSDQPILSLEERQQIQRHRLLQKNLPPSLLADSWELSKQPDGYKIFHFYTRLETDAHLSQGAAIDEALHLAAFFGLLPVADLALMESSNPMIFSKPPCAIAARYRYASQSFNEQQWFDEYRTRHPQPEALTKEMAQKLLLTEFAA